MEINIAASIASLLLFDGDDYPGTIADLLADIQSIGPGPYMQKLAGMFDVKFMQRHKDNNEHLRITIECQCSDGLAVATIDIDPASIEILPLQQDIASSGNGSKDAVG